MKEKTLQQRKMTCLLTSSEELDDSDMQIIFQFFEIDIHSHTTKKFKENQ